MIAWRARGIPASGKGQAASLRVNEAAGTGLNRCQACVTSTSAALTHAIRWLNWIRKNFVVPTTSVRSIGAEASMLYANQYSPLTAGPAATYDWPAGIEYFVSSLGVRRSSAAIGGGEAGASGAAAAQTGVEVVPASGL